ncbi:helicase associated domain-containing protein [Streptomyces griseofuscus]|uniref:helicase associated domain-containing protein n=1 Tax=Streptomyces griseofuscus TaxID=146922 RepID=UPI0036859BFC
MAHARTYAAAHGHLATPQKACHEGFPLGRWLSEQRHQTREHHRSTGGTWPVSTLLTELDPRWNPTWPLDRQRNWRRVSSAADGSGGTGIPGLEKELADWLKRQYTGYGITAETARAAQPPAARAEPGLLDTALA